MLAATGPVQSLLLPKLLGTIYFVHWCAAETIISLASRKLHGDGESSSGRTWHENEQENVGQWRPLTRSGVRASSSDIELLKHVMDMIPHQHLQTNNLYGKCKWNIFFNSREIKTPLTFELNQSWPDGCGVHVELRPSLVFSAIVYSSTVGPGLISLRRSRYHLDNTGSSNEVFRRSLSSEHSIRLLAVALWHVRAPGVLSPQLACFGVHVGILRKVNIPRDLCR